MALPTLAVDIGFATDPGLPPTWVDISEYVRSASIRRGRSHELDRVEAGTATVLLDNRDGRFDPANALSPYWPNVLPMRQVRIRATWEGVGYILFRGYIESWPQSWASGGVGDATVTLQAVDGFKPFALATLNGTFASGLSGDRIAAVLSAIGWPGNLLSTNQASIETDTTGWTVNANCTIVRSLAQAQDGVASLSLTAVGAGAMSAYAVSGTAAITPGQTYTAVASFRAATTSRSCRLSIAFNGPSGFLGDTTGSSVSDGTGGWTQATVQMIAPADAISATLYVEVLGAGASEGHYVDQIGIEAGTSTVWQHPRSSEFRAIDAGNSLVQAGTLADVAALAHIQEVETTEDGIFFISREGVAVFLDRNRIISSTLDATLYTWGDAGLENRYEDLVPAFDDSQIWGEAVVSAPGKTDATALSASSVRRFFGRTRTVAGLWELQAEMEDRADYVVLRFGEPLQRIAAITLDPMLQNAQWPRVLSRDLHDKVRVVKRPFSGAQTISQDSVIEGIAHEIQPGRWRTVWSLSPFDPARYWVLGDSVYGVLDSTTRLYY